MGDIVVELVSFVVIVCGLIVAQFIAIRREIAELRSDIKVDTANLRAEWREDMRQSEDRSREEARKSEQRLLHYVINHNHMVKEQGHTTYFTSVPEAAASLPPEGDSKH